MLNAELAGASKVNRGLGAKVARALGILGWVLVLVLIGFQVLTLSYAPVHDRAYQALARVVGSIHPELLGFFTEHSPTARAEVERERATRAVSEQLDQVVAAVRILAVERAQLAVEGAAVQSELLALQGAFRNRAAALTQMVQKVSGRFSSRAGRSIKGLPARAVPYAGIAFLIAATGIDIQEDCEIAQELTALAKASGAAAIDPGEVCTWAAKVPSWQEVWHDLRH